MLNLDGLLRIKENKTQRAVNKHLNDLPHLVMFSKTLLGFSKCQVSEENYKTFSVFPRVKVPLALFGSVWEFHNCNCVSLEINL